MSIYRRYVSRDTLRRLSKGWACAAHLHHTEPGAADYTHPIHIVVPDEDAPEPPEIDFEREHRAPGGHAITILGPPAWDPIDSEWVVLVRWDTGIVSAYDLSALTPIEPAPERTYTAEQVREAFESCVLADADFIPAVLARLEGSDE